MSAGTGTQPASSAGGATQIIGATIIAGIAGYLVTFLVYRVVGPAPYALFAIFWASLYLGVGALSGIQQEVTRATHPIEPGSRHGANRARAFGVVAAVLVFVATIASAVLWVDAVFPADGWALVWPLAVGASAYVLVATLSGSLYGVSQWRSLALMISLDGVLRLALVGAILTTSNDIVALAWAVALPFPLAIMLLWPVIRRTFVGRSDIDVGYGRLTWNVARTVLAAVSTAVLVSAFPLLLGVTARGADAALIGELVFTLTLTRAPLVVSVMALQSYFIVQFRQRLEHWAGFLLKVMGVLAAGGVLLALAGWWLGSPVFELVSGAPVTARWRLHRRHGRVIRPRRSAQRERVRRARQGRAPRLLGRLARRGARHRDHHGAAHRRHPPAGRRRDRRRPTASGSPCTPCGSPRRPAAHLQ
jgi:O-antigen/teichoic acid export membrane protein